MRWYHGWTILAVTLVMQTVIWGLGSVCFTFWVLPWMNAFGVGRSEVMTAITASVVVMGLSSPLAGWAMDRYSARLFICLGIISFVLGFLLISQASTAWEVSIYYALFIGLSGAFSGPLAAQILATRWFDSRRGMALGISATGLGWGGLIMPHLVTELIATHGWRQAALVVAIIPLFLLPLVWLTIRDYPESLAADAQPTRVQSAQMSSEPQRHWSVSTILRDRGFLIVVLTFTPLMITIYGIMQNLAPYSNDQGFSPIAAASFMAVLSGFMMVGKVVSGVLSDRMDNRLLFWIAVLLIGASYLGLLIKPGQFWLMFAVCGLFGFGVGGSFPLMATIIGKRFGAAAFGRAMGVIYPFSNLCAIGAVLMGWMRDTTGSYDSSILIFLLTLIPVALLMAYFPQERRRSGPGRDNLLDESSPSTAGLGQS
jgi:MFS family permease